jgi:hypothetical protein
MQQLIDLVEVASSGVDVGGSTAPIEGNTRKVSIFPDYVIKTDIRENHYPFCQTEWEVYHSVADIIQVHLAKPFYISKNGRSLAMERVDQVGLYPNEEIVQEIDDVRDTIKQIMGDDVAKYLLSDDCSFNFGRRRQRGGNLVYMDYAGITTFTKFDVDRVAKLLEHELSV